MRRILLTTLFMLSLVKVKAQSEQDLLGVSVDSVLSYEHYFIRLNDNGMETKLLSRKNISSNRVVLSYCDRIFYQNRNHYTYKVYYFENSKLVSVAIQTSAVHEYEQVTGMINSDFFKISERVLYSKKNNLKATIYNYSGKHDWYIILYTRKNFKTPENVDFID